MFGPNLDVNCKLVVSHGCLNWMYCVRFFLLGPVLDGPFSFGFIT